MLFLKYITEIYLNSIILSLKMNKVFFEIPIYRTTEQNHDSDMKDIIDRQCSKYPFLEGSYLENFKVTIQEKSCYQWKYNDIIGYLNLYIFGSQLRVDYYLISNKRINKGIIKKKFINNWKTYEADIDKTKSSIEIFEWILKELKDLEKRKFRKRYFDLHSFQLIGKYVDWKSLVNELNSRLPKNY